MKEEILIFLNAIWPWVENYGTPILGALVLLLFVSINGYLADCKNLSRMESHLKNNNTLRGYKDQSLPFIGISTLFYAFKPISKFDSELLNYKKSKEQLESIKSYRKLYVLGFPILMSIAAIGIAINELIIDS